MIKAVAYARYSSDNQREESIEAQLRAIKEYCEKENMQLIKIYADEAKSATTDQRPEFLNLINDSSMGLFSVVIVHKLDRFSRDRYDSAFYKRQLKQNGVRLISVLEQLDDSPESVILESVLEGMAEYYSKNLSREVMKGMRETALQCKHTGGKPPLGFDVAPDKTYTINEFEAEAIRLIFKMYAEGEGYSAIISTLNSKGFKTKNNKPFGKNSLHDILKNEKYKGVFVFNKASSKNGKRNSHKAKPDNEIIRIPGGCPAVVSNELWGRVEKRMDENKKATGAYSAKITYLLSGLIYCGKCGGAMVGNRAKTGRNKAEYAYYECSTRKRTKNCDMKSISKPFIEEKILDALYENLFADHVIDLATDMIYKHAASKNTEIPKQIATMEKQLGSVEVEIKNIVNAIAAGMFHESMKEKMDELEASKSALKIRIDEASLQQQSHSLTREQIRSFLNRYRKIKDMTPAEQKEAIRIFVNRVTVYDDRIDIDVLTIPGGKKNKTAIRQTGGNETLQNSHSGCLDSSLDLLVEANRNPSSPNESLRITVSIDDYRHKN